MTRADHPSIAKPASSHVSVEVARAEQCDAAGKHYDAVNHLVAGARKHDVEASTRLGKRLLLGDRAPHRPKDGAGLLADTSKRGGAEAASMLSVLFGVGAYVERDLGAAFENLVKAAERGWPDARQQIAVLNGFPAFEETWEAETLGENWRRLAGNIDITAWQKTLPGKDLHASPLIRSFPDLIDATVCRWLIERSRGRLSRALVYDPNVHKVTAHETRTNSAAILNLLSADFVSVLVQSRMAACLGTAFRYFEPVNVLHYDPGEQITEHYDFVDPGSPDYKAELAQKGQRIVTFLIYLNDDYVGGETEFPRLGITHKGCRGEGLFFVNSLPDDSPDTRTQHAGRPTSEGEKWIVSQFVRSRAVL